jgi:hypothetical protein
MDDLSFTTLLVCALGLLAGGLIKGVIGVALPVVAVPILTTVVTMPQAVALLAMPILAANTWQSGGVAHVGRTLRRFWPLLATLVVGLVFGTSLLVSAETDLLYIVVGAAIIMISAAQLLAPRLHVSPPQERWVSPLVGVVAGILGGLAGMFGAAIATYMIALRLPRDTFIASTAVAFLCAGLPLAALLFIRGVYDQTLFLLSLGACLPVFGGLLLGEAVRRRVDPKRFRTIVLGALAVIGLDMLRRGLT